MTKENFEQAITEIKAQQICWQCAHRYPCHHRNCSVPETRKEPRPMVLLAKLSCEASHKRDEAWDAWIRARDEEAMLQDELGERRKLDERKGK